MITKVFGKVIEPRFEHPSKADSSIFCTASPNSMDGNNVQSEKA